LPVPPIILTLLYITYNCLYLLYLPFLYIMYNCLYSYILHLSFLQIMYNRLYLHYSHSCTLSTIKGPVTKYNGELFITKNFP
jgi:hypothetical protein